MFFFFFKKEFPIFSAENIPFIMYLSCTFQLRDPLKTPVMFIGKKKDGSMESHQPKSLAELYELEKLYETFKVITL